jgi:hypothetical protein
LDLRRRWFLDLWRNGLPFGDMRIERGRTCAEREDYGSGTADRRD